MRVFGLSRGDWDLRVWGRNLTDDQWLITNFPGVAQTGTWTGYGNQPRTYGATLNAILSYACLASSGKTE